jgi:hypothetical protein
VAARWSWISASGTPGGLAGTPTYRFGAINAFVGKTAPLMLLLAIYGQYNVVTKVVQNDLSGSRLHYCEEKQKFSGDYSVGVKQQSAAANDLTYGLSSKDRLFKINYLLFNVELADRNESGFKTLRVVRHQYFKETSI